MSGRRRGAQGGVQGAKELRAAWPGLRRTWLYLQPYLRPHRRLMVGGVAALLADVGFRLMEPWPLAWVLNAVVDPARRNADLIPFLAVCAVAVVAFAGLRAGASYLSTVALASAGNRALTQVRSDLYQHMLALSLRYHARVRSGDLLNRLIGDVGRVQDVAITAALPLAGNVITLVGMTAVMFWLDPLLGLVLLAALPLFLITSSRQSRRITTAARDQRRREGDLAGTVAETLGAIHVVQSYGLERELGRQFGRSNAGSLRDGVRGARLSAGLERKTDLLVGLATAVILFAGGSRVLAGQLTAGELIVFLQYLKSAFKPLRDLAKYTGRLAKAAASGERILDLADQVPDVAERPDARVAERFAGAVRFEGVSASWDGRHTVLHDVDLDVPAGSRVGLVGRSGSGKSTLVSLLVRLQDPVSGRVLVDGQDVRDLTLESLRSQVAVVPQDTVLFAASLRENIRLGRPGASDDDVERAAVASNVHEFAVRLPEGYDTVLGERGSTLSGGQRQRVAIARAMLRDAPLVVLDEAITGLDATTGARVVEALDRLTRGRTTFVISHDPEAVRDCDLVVRVHEGRVVEVSRPGTVNGTVNHGGLHVGAR
jgi:ATP-binding cassette subfamily B protein